GSVAGCRDLQLTVILTGKCIFGTGDALKPAVMSTSSLHPEATSVIPAGDLTSPSSVRIFSALAALSGGMFFRVNRSEFTQAANILLLRTRPENADILYAIDSTAGGKSYAIPVDSTLSDVTFVVNRLSTSSFFTL